MSASTTVEEVRVMLYPRDFQKTQEFYARVLHWPIRSQWDRADSRGTMFDMGSGISELLWPPERAPGVPGAALSLRVANVWQLWQELREQASVVFALRQNAWGDDSFCLADPDGFALVFFTDR